MKNFVVADQNGLIVRVGICPDFMMDIQAQDGESVMEGIARPGIDRIVDGQIVSGDDTEQKKVEAQAEMRKRRNKLLFKSDITQLSDSQITDAKKTEWSLYRQALRDLPESYSDIMSVEEVTWPEPPES